MAKTKALISAALFSHMQKAGFSNDAVHISL